MQNSPLSRISASIPIGKKSKFNLSHDVNTTYDWGSVQPLFSKLMLPDSSINLNTEQLTRLAPMVAPTFGRVKLKNIAHFIPCSDIYPNWDAMMSKTKVIRPLINTFGGASTSVYVPTHVPYIPNSVLAAFCLVGCRVNMYFSGPVGTDSENTWECARNNAVWSSPTWSNATVAVREYLNKLLGIQNTSSPTTSTLVPFNYTGYTLRFARLLTRKDGSRIFSVAGSSFAIPTISTMGPVLMANATGQGWTHSASNEVADPLFPVDDHVTMEGADLIWEYAGSDSSSGISVGDRAANSGTPVDSVATSEFDGCKIRLVFKFSSFGKRLRKILIGLGYDVNLLNDDNVSILPLVSYYKAWWDTFAPERFKNFYETNAWKVIQSSMVSASAADLMVSLLNISSLDFQNYFLGFMSDLGTCFATDRMDVISAATDEYYGQINTTTDANARTAIVKSIIDAVHLTVDEPVNSSGYTGTGADGSLFSNTVVGDNPTANGIALWLSKGGAANSFTQPQIDSLKKAYIMMNKTSVAGMKVEEILRALGFGDYVEECKGKFITASDDNIKISDVVATAATSDAELGQYGGRGIGFGKFQFSYSTGRYGYLIVMSCIVPESGYVNSPVHENEAISMESMYNMELDGVAYEAIQKKQITGSPLVSDGSYRDTFGFLPTYSQWKFMSNKANGDFSLNSRKQYMLPYTLDKYIPVSNANVYRTFEDPNHVGSDISMSSPRFTYSDLPNAGEDWRFVNKFPWNGDFNRIFSEQDDGYEWSVFSPNNNAFLYNSFEYDNFMTHCVFNIAYFAHMKSIEDAYGTYDEEHGAPNSTVKRS